MIMCMMASTSDANFRRVLENLVAAVYSTSSIDMDGFRALKYVVAVTSGCLAIFVSFG